jgi:shikimate kinase
MTPKHNLVLTGFMGTGKTTVGQVLAEMLGLEFVDTDTEIEGRHGPIPEIFAARGEETFREFERVIARDLGQRRGLVVATGGKMLLDQVNVDALGSDGLIVCLVATPSEIFARVTSEAGWTERPLLRLPDPRQRIIDLLAERAAGYAQFPQITTDGASPAEIADRIIELWNGRDTAEL